MNRHLLRDLTDMVSKGFISEETAGKIQEYYKTKHPEARNQLFTIFGILGSVLVGLGLILIIAHNWDEMSRWLKTIWAILPMIVAQGICLYVLLKKAEIAAWREGSSAFLFFTIGACIALVGQIYNIPGELDSYLRSWLLLTLPLMYIMRSSISSLLYILGVSYYGLVVNFEYVSFEKSGPELWYWGLLTMALPYYFMLHKKNPRGSFMIFHNWIISISITLMLGSVLRGIDGSWIIGFVLYAALFGLYYQIGLSSFTRGNNAFLVLGSIGGLIMLFIGSFRDFWVMISEEAGNIDFNISFILIGIFIIATVFMIAMRYNKDQRVLEDSQNYISFVYLLMFLSALVINPILPTVFSNIIVAVLGVLTIREGVKNEHLGILNYGLLMVSVLIICRFFDTNMTFVIRGILFIMIGVGFFTANYMMMKKKSEL